MASKKNHADSDTAPRKTLFVRNLSFETTSKQLEEAFSEYGPIKQAFVVKDRDNASKCRGFGYVHFVLQDDADSAVKVTKSINDRKVRLCYASKKPKHEKRKKQQAEDAAKKEEASKEEDVVGKEDDEVIADDSGVDKESVELKKETESEENVKPKLSNVSNQSQNDKTDLQRTLVLTGLTSKVKRKAFRILCEKFGEIENIVYPVSDRSEITAFVRFKTYKSVIRAVQKIPGQKCKKSNTLSAVLLTKEGKFPSKKVLESSRLIIRNLDFKCEESDLQEIFSKFGKIVGINIPTKKVNNREVKIGCAFIQYANKNQAKAAIDEMNLKEVKGRAVVIDWAVSKEKYEEKKDEKKPAVKKDGSVKVEEKKTKAEKIKKPKKEDVVKDEEISDAEENTDETIVEKDLSDAESDEEDQELDTDRESMDNSDEEEGSDVDSAENEDDDDEDENEEDEEDEEMKKRKKEQMKDAKEGKTVFIRNLSYNIEEDELVEEFEKYGDVDYCKIVYDRETGRSKGSGFIKFKEKESADSCVDELDKLEKEEKPLRIDGRPVFVSLAVTRGKVNEIVRQKSDQKKETDKRNLYLAYEGMLTKNTPGYEVLSEGERKKREKALAEKKTKLKNPNYFVSRTRLCFRNLPLSTDANELRKILKKYGTPQMKINEIKIMRSQDGRVDTNGVPRSLGFGFVNVNTHENALNLLRETNNNPEIFGEQRRPMVEFSVENAKALKLLEQRKHKNDQKVAQFKDGEEVNAEKTLGSEAVRDKRRQDWWAKKVTGYQKLRVKKRSEREAGVAKNPGGNENESNLAGSSQQSTSNIQKSTNSTPSKRVPKPKDGTAKQNKSPKTVRKETPVRTASESGFLKRKFENTPTDNDIHINNKRGRKLNQITKRKDEDKFNNLVSKYKDKLFGNDSSVTKKKKPKGERWFT